MSTNNHEQEMISDLVDRLVAAAKALPKDLFVERTADGIAIEGPRLRLRRIADPCLRDLIGTAAHLDPNALEP